MQIDRQQILGMLIEQGKGHLVPQAEAELPERVDPTEHAGLLAKFGLTPQDLLTKFVTGGVRNLFH